MVQQIDVASRIGIEFKLHMILRDDTRYIAQVRLFTINLHPHCDDFKPYDSCANWHANAMQYRCALWQDVEETNGGGHKNDIAGTHVWWLENSGQVC